MTPIRVLLADDHPLVRCGIRKLLDKTSGIDVVGEVSDGVAALQQTIELQPDVLVLDVEMPGLRGDEVARRLRAMKLPVRILILSVYSNRQQISELLAAGVDGYVAKQEAIETIVQAIQAMIAQEQSWLSPRAAENLLPSSPVLERKHPLLTDREAEVLHLAARGGSDTEIARRLQISKRTVRFHLQHVYSKLGVGRRCEAIVWAMREGLDAPRLADAQQDLVETPC